MLLCEDMKTDCQLDYKTVLCGRAEVVHLALVFKGKRHPKRLLTF
jgi:hypothetical protein